MTTVADLIATMELALSEKKGIVLYPYNYGADIYYQLYGFSLVGTHKFLADFQKAYALGEDLNDYYNNYYTFSDTFFWDFVKDGWEYKAGYKFSAYYGLYFVNLHRLINKLLQRNPKLMNFKNSYLALLLLLDAAMSYN